MAGPKSCQLLSSRIGSCLGRLFGSQRSNWRALHARADDLHLLPVVGEFFAAIETNHIGSRRECSRVATAFLHRDRKAITAVPAPEQGIEEPGEHLSTSQNRRSNCRYT